MCNTAFCLKWQCFGHKHQKGKRGSLRKAFSGHGISCWGFPQAVMRQQIFMTGFSLTEKSPPSAAHSHHDFHTLKTDLFEWDYYSQALRTVKILILHALSTHNKRDVHDHHRTQAGPHCVTHLFSCSEELLNSPAFLPTRDGEPPACCRSKALDCYAAAQHPATCRKGCTKAVWELHRLKYNLTSIFLPRAVSTAPSSRSSGFGFVWCCVEMGVGLRGPRGSLPT